MKGTIKIKCYKQNPYNFKSLTIISFEDLKSQIIKQECGAL